MNWRRHLFYYDPCKPNKEQKTGSGYYWCVEFNLHHESLYISGDEGYDPAHVDSEEAFQIFMTAILQAAKELGWELRDKCQCGCNCES